MSFNNASRLNPKLSKIEMAKWEIHKRLGIINAIWWAVVPGKEITVKWPVGWTTPIPAPGGGFIQIESADPNDHYRPWLEENVGRQGWDWDWKIGPIAADNGSGTVGFGKAKWASMAALKWG